MSDCKHERYTLTYLKFPRHPCHNAYWGFQECDACSAKRMVEIVDNGSGPVEEPLHPWRLEGGKASYEHLRITNTRFDEESMELVLTLSPGTFFPETKV